MPTVILRLPSASASKHRLHPKPWHPCKSANHFTKSAKRAKRCHPSKRAKHSPKGAKIARAIPCGGHKVRRAHRHEGRSSSYCGELWTCRRSRRGRTEGHRRHTPKIRDGI